nr:protein 104 [synthetic construct]
MGLTDVASTQAEYTTSTRHFLLIGFLAMFVASVVFCYLGMKKKKDNIPETLVFIITSVAAGSYYIMWSGYAVAHKTDANDQHRMIFWGRYVDWFITTPLLLLTLSMVAEAEAGMTILLIGIDMLMITSGAIGASVVHPYKWFWWTLGVIFFIVVMFMLVGLNSTVKENKPDIAIGFRTLIVLTAISWCVYPIVWVLGSEGLAAVHIDVEVGLICLADLVSKVVFGLYLVFSVNVGDNGGDSAEKTSLVPAFSSEGQSGEDLLRGRVSPWFDLEKCGCRRHSGLKSHGG